MIRRACALLLLASCTPGPLEGGAYRCDFGGPAAQCPENWRCGIESHCHFLGDVSRPWRCNTAAQCEADYQCGLDNARDGGECHDPAVGIAYACLSDAHCSAGWHCGPEGRCYDRTVPTDFLCRANAGEEHRGSRPARLRRLHRALRNPRPASKSPDSMLRPVVRVSVWPYVTPVMHAPPPTLPPAVLTQQPTRRNLLKAFGIGGVVLAGGAWVWNTVGRFGPPAEGRLVFDADEFRILEKVCEAVFPGPPDYPFSAHQVQTAEFVDAYVSNLYDDLQLLFRTLIRTLNVSPIVTHGRSFYWLGLEKRQAVLEQWANSDLRLRRAGYQSLTFAVKLGYFEDDRVRAAGGFVPGCNLPQAGRPPGLGTRNG